MRELLDTPTQRRLKILENLNEASDWISSNELALNNDASLRTINNDISYLKDNWFPLLLIETSKKNGVRLTTQASSHMEIVYRHILKNSEAFKLLESMFFDTSLSIEKWGEKLYISEPSLYRITNAMSISLAKYGLKLEKKPCRIVGENEFFVRCFYTSFFREAYSITEWPFPSNKKDSINYIRHITNYFKYELDDNRLAHIFYLFNISLIRQSQGFYIDPVIPDEQFNKVKKLLEKYHPSFEKIVAQYNLTVDDRMMKDLIFTIFYHQNNWQSQEEEVLVTKEINHFIKTLRDFFDITLSNTISDKIEGSMKHLYLYHQLYPFRNHIIFDDYFYNGTAIKSEYPIFNTIVTKSLTELEKKTNFPWETTYHNVILYWLMIKWNDLPSILSEKKDKAKIIVVSDLGHDHAEFLSKMIRNNFGSKANIEYYKNSVIFLEDENPAVFESFNIIVTNFNTDLLPEEKLVVIDDIPSSGDWGLLRRAINGIHKIEVSQFKELKSN